MYKYQKHLVKYLTLYECVYVYIPSFHLGILEFSASRKVVPHPRDNVSFIKLSQRAPPTPTPGR